MTNAERILAIKTQLETDVRDAFSLGAAKVYFNQPRLPSQTLPIASVAFEQTGRIDGKILDDRYLLQVTIVGRWQDPPVTDDRFEFQLSKYLPLHSKLTPTASVTGSGSYADVGLAPQVVGVDFRDADDTPLRTVEIEVTWQCWVLLDKSEVI